MPNVKPANYAPLHCHTTYSMGDAYGTPQQLASAMAAAGCPGGAVTEHGNAYSLVKWAKACKAVGIKPAYGVEHYITQDRTSREAPPVRGQDPEGYRRHPNRRYHITTLAVNREGWANQMRMLTAAHNKDPEQGGGYWYKPRIDWQLLFKHSEGIVATSGCMSSFSSQRVLEGDEDRAEAYMKRMADVFGDRWFLEVMPIGFQGQEKINVFCQKMHTKHGWPLLVTNDVHYPKAADWDKRTFLLRQNRMDNYDELGSLYVYDQRTLVEAWAQHVGPVRLSKAIESSHRILDMTAEDTVPKAPPVNYPVPKEFRSAKNPALAYMQHLCKLGWRKRGIPTREPYISRIQKELKLLTEKRFIDQVLLVWCIIDFCRRNGIMVGTRGSAAGSLVCYLLEITDLDPLEFDLLFERFVDITRNDPPDIDIDIQHNRRDEVKAFLRDLFGSDSVGDICTFAAYRSRAALQAVAAEQNIPMSEVNVIINLLAEKDNDLVGSSESNISLIRPTVERHPNAAKVMEKYPALWMAESLDGMIRHTSKHSGGVVVATDDVDLTSVAFFNTEGVWSLDKKDAEGLGFLKIDALGLITMTCLGDCREAVKESHNVDLVYERLPLDDPETVRGFTEADMQGIFQYEGRTARLVTQRVAPVNFDEIIDINALCRPGPMYGGATEAYVEAGHGGMAETWPHDDLNEITSKTRGTLLYQEQMLNIMVKVGGMSWDDVTHARRCISKRLGLDVMNQLRDRFVVGAGKNGLSKEQANFVWDRMVTFGTYAFNKSHAAAYARVGYWCMYVKRHYPNEFYACFSRHISNEHHKRRLIQEFLIRGGKLLPPCVNKSGLSFTLEKDGIRPGLSDIKHIGEKAAQHLIEGRPYKRPEDALKATYIGPNGKPRKVLNKTSASALINLGAIAGDRTMEAALAPEYYYSFWIPAGISELRLPSYTTCGEVRECENMEIVTILGRVATRWNNTYADKKHRVEDSAATKKYGQTGTDENRTITYKIELEDETGEIFVTFRKHYHANSEVLKALRPGDWIVVDGRWVADYDRVSGSRISIVRTKEQAKPGLYVDPALFE